MLICEIVGNMDTILGKYDHNILIRLNLRTTKTYLLDVQVICSAP